MIQVPKNNKFSKTRSRSGQENSRVTNKIYYIESLLILLYKSVLIIVGVLN